MGLQMVLDSSKERESPEISNWYPGLEDQSTPTFKIPPRLRCCTGKDYTSLRLSTSDRFANALSSPALPISLAFRELNSKPVRKSQSNTSKTGIPSDTTRSSKLSPFNHFTWLALYFTFNLFLTLSNKSVLTGFPFPYTLTALHALCSTIGGLALRWRGFYVTKRLSIREEAALAAFSVVYGLNVAVSNVSLNLVTVPFHQIVRAVTPIFTLILSTILLNSRFSGRKLISLAPVILGVVFATYGDYYFTLWGLLLTLFGTILAALKTILTSVLQSSSQTQGGAFYGLSANRLSAYSAKNRHLLTTAPTWSMYYSICVRGLRQLVPPRLDLHPLDLLSRMSPLAFVQCMVYAQLSGELSRLRSVGVLVSSEAQEIHLPQIARTSFYDCVHVTEIRIGGGVTPTHLLILVINGCIAFGLNIVSFSANGKVGPLSMTVAANVKQVLTILCAVSMFNLTITPTNAFGITITLLGGAWYAWVEYTSKGQQRKKEDGHIIGR